MDAASELCELFRDYGGRPDVKDQVALETMQELAAKVGQGRGTQHGARLWHTGGLTGHGLACSTHGRVYIHQFTVPITPLRWHTSRHIDALAMYRTTQQPASPPGLPSRPQVRGQLQALSEWVSERSAPMTSALSAASQELGAAVQALLADIVSEAMGDPDANMEVRQDGGGGVSGGPGAGATRLEVREGFWRGAMGTWWHEDGVEGFLPQLAVYCMHVHVHHSLPSIICLDPDLPAETAPDIAAGRPTVRPHLLFCHILPNVFRFPVRALAVRRRPCTACCRNPRHCSA